MQYLWLLIWDTQDLSFRVVDLKHWEYTAHEIKIAVRQWRKKCALGALSN